MVSPCRPPATSQVDSLVPSNLPIWHSCFTGQSDDIASVKWINVTEFFDRAHRAQKPLVISVENFDSKKVRFPLLKTILAP